MVPDQNTQLTLNGTILSQDLDLDSVPGKFPKAISYTARTVMTKTNKYFANVCHVDIENCFEN